MVRQYGSNSGDAEVHLARIEAKLVELEEMREEYLKACEAVRDDIKGLYREARDQGIEVKPLKGLVKYRALERKQQRIADAFDEAETAATYEALIDTFGDLGRAAAERAGVRREQLAIV